MSLVFLKEPLWQLNILFGIYMINLLWSLFILEFKHKIRMLHSVINDVGGIILTIMHYIFISPWISDF